MHSSRGKNLCPTISQSMPALGGPIFSRMTNGIDQDVISLRAGPADCNRSECLPPRHHGIKEEGSARINFEFHAASGDLGASDGGKQHSTNLSVGILWPSIKITAGRKVVQEGLVIKSAFCSGHRKRKAAGQIAKGVLGAALFLSPLPSKRRVD